MATLENGKVKLNNGQVVTPSVGGWYDGQRFMNGQLTAPGVLETGEAVNPEVLKAQGNTAYIAEQQKKTKDASFFGS